MVRGFYTSASGLTTQEKKLNAYANNVANATTPGYKKDNLIAGTFGEHMAIRMDTYKRQGDAATIGRGVFMQTIDDKYTDHTQGSLETTERALDLAVMGEGYFVIRGGDGDNMLTRDGQMALDEDGYLVLPGAGRVQGEGGDIEIGTSDFVVDAMGIIYRLPDGEDPDEEPEEIDRLMVVIPTDYAEMDKNAIGLFTTNNYFQVTADDNSVIRQGLLEKSNVDMSEEMTRIIASQRGLQSASQLVRMYDEMSQKSTEQLGRIR